ncbi:MAG: hypothetical protein Q4E68_04875 [Prevotellaceae bacterium]|nr:hypothetical protein [Prevotellaceae bacterium]
MRKTIRNIANSLREKYILLPSLYGKSDVDNIGVCVRGMGVGLLLLLLSSCSDDGPTNHADLAAETAKAYYDQLTNGDIASFVDGTVMHVEVVPTYREQLETNMKMFIGQQERDHKGIKSVKKVKGALTCPTNENGEPKDTSKLTANAFLIFNYGDNTSEEVVVPMVRVNGTWMMR